MPTINFSLRDLQQLVGKTITIEELEELATYCKGEFDGYDAATDTASLSLDDTNLPYLWSVEGIARLLRGALGLEKGIPPLEISKSDHSIVVDKGVQKVRPFIAGFVARGKKIDDYLLKQLVQLQEKFCEGYGRRRKKVSIGLYSYKRIKFPIHYKAVKPESVKFTPLESDRLMNLREILQQHPKGKDYAYILEGFDAYPILLDDAGEVLSFPPIINSNFTGKVEESDEDLFFEVTGTDEESIYLAANIFCQALYERGFELYSVTVNYPERKVVTPHLFKDTIRLKEEEIEGLLGLKLTKTQVKKLLESAGYEFDDYKITIPPYRKDILHPVDVIEDIGIMYGYTKIEEAPMTAYTLGGTSGTVRFVNRVRDLAVGLGFQELFSAVLTNKKYLYENMLCPDTGCVEIEKYMSETYSVVRSWLLPILMEALSKNKHADYPQRLFEQGICTVRKDENVVDYEKISLAVSEDKADFTSAKQVLDTIMRLLKLEFSLKPLEHPSFIPGRCAEIIINGKPVGFLGEVRPEVLEKWELDTPVAALELNLSEMQQFT